MRQLPILFPSQRGDNAARYPLSTFLLVEGALLTKLDASEGDDLDIVADLPWRTSRCRHPR